MVEIAMDKAHCPPPKRDDLVASGTAGNSRAPISADDSSILAPQTLILPPFDASRYTASCPYSDLQSQNSREPCPTTGSESSPGCAQPQTLAKHDISGLSP